jgi:hypothetical protein
VAPSGPNVLGQQDPLLSVWPQSQNPRPQCLVANSGSASIANNAATPITFDTRVYDPCGMRNGTHTDRIYIPVAGVYLVVGNITWAASATGIRTLQVYHNGSSTPWLASVTGSGSMQVAAVLFLQAYDYLQLSVLQASGGALAASGIAASVTQLL